jgi:hypothetical protein
MDNFHDLLSLVDNYHPQQNRKVDYDLPITAPGAEAACATIRKEIRDESLIFNPREVFEEAYNKEDWNTITKLLSDTWFGVPESTACWQIPGFKVCVDILDDPFDEMEDEL